MKVFKTVMIFMLGVGLGSGATYFLVKEVLEREAEEQIEEVREHYRAKEQEVDETAKADAHLVSKLDCEKKATVIQYNNFVKKHYAPPVETDAAEEEDPEEVNEDEGWPIVPTFEYPGPYVITEEEFSEDFLHHEKLSLTYYTDDETLSDDKETIVDDVNGIVGESAIKELYKESTVFVRNERIGIDYEIMRVKNAYSRVVLGVLDDTPKKPSRAKKVKTTDVGTED